MTEQVQQETQPRVLIIDDRPEIANRVRWAVPEWHVEEAPNGAAGIALIRQHWNELDLVLLDVFMPHEGVMTMAQINGEAQARGQPQFRVVPFTVTDDLIDLQTLAALGAEPPLNKALPDQELRSALHERIGRSVRPLAREHVLLPYLLRRALHSEQEVRNGEQRRLQVALLQKNALYGGLCREALIAAGCSVVAFTDRVEAMRPLLINLRVALLVSDAAFGLRADELSRQFDLPLLLIAATPSAAFRAAGAGRNVLLELPEPAALADIVEQVVKGIPYRDVALEKLLDIPALNDSEREVFRMLLEGCRSDEIAEVLVMPLQSVRRHRSHLLLKLGLEHTQQLRDWVDGVTGLGATYS